MPRSAWVGVLVSVVGLSSAASVRAEGRIHAAYWWDPCGMPGVVFYPALPAPPLVIREATRLPNNYQREYAPVSPAPPSPMPPPLPDSSASATPKVQESLSSPAGTASRTSYYEAFAVAPGTDGAVRASGEEICSVSFWNLSEQALWLGVASQWHRLERGQQVSVNVPRQFRWQLDGRPVETTSVRAESRALEIVIRR